MTTTTGFRTRTPIKQNEILSRIRRKIVEGKLQPGTQLPTRKELEREFKVSGVTLQRALDQLMRDGFVYARGAMGTFVAENLPFVCNYGVVFPSRYSEKEWNRFWVGVKTEAERLAAPQVGAPSESPDDDPLLNRGARVSIYYSDDGNPDSVEYLRLLRDIHGHRLAGLVFVNVLDSYHGTPLLDAPGLARVAIHGQVEHVPTSVQLSGLIDRALDYFAKRGRKRVALVSSSDMISIPEFVRQWTEGAKARNLFTQPTWIQGANIHYPQTARNLTHLLMSSRPEDRPDGLLIGDDNLVEYASIGLIDAGVAVPDDVKVIAHCNFPWPTPSVLPVKRLGYDVRECLRACIEAIDQQRQGLPVQPVIPIPARFEEEVAPP